MKEIRLTIREFQQLITMASEAAAVARKLQETKENRVLNLCNSSLLKIPDAVYLILKDISVQECDLSENGLRSIPSKFPAKFSDIVCLNLNSNSLSSLPMEFENFHSIKTLDISRNNFTVLPEVVYSLESLVHLHLEGNQIQDLDVGRLQNMPSLQKISLAGNPLPDEVKEALKVMSPIVDI